MTSIEPIDVEKWPIDKKISKDEKKFFNFLQKKSKNVLNDSSNDIENIPIIKDTDLNTYHIFRDSCGFKMNRKCACLSKFVRMPLWFLILIFIIFLIVFFIISLLFGLIIRLNLINNCKISTATLFQYQTASSILPTIKITEDLCKNQSIFNPATEKCMCKETTFGDFCEKFVPCDQLEPDPIECKDFAEVDVVNCPKRFRCQ